MNLVRSLLEYLNADEFLDSISGLARARTGLVKAQVKEKATAVITKIIIIAVIGFAFVFFLLFLSLMLGNYLNVVLESKHLGYGLVALFYLLVMIILFMIKNIKGLRSFLERTAGKLFNNKN